VKIVFVNNQYQLGGAETVMHQLLRGAAQAGHETSLYVALGKTYPPDVIPLYPRLLSLLEHSRLNGLIKSLFPRFKWTDRNFRRLADGPADVIHVHNFHGTYATTPSMAFLAARKPVVWTFHAFWGMTGGCDHPKDCFRYQATCGSCPQVGQWPVGPVDHTREEMLRKIELLAPAPLTIVAPSRHLAAKVRESQVGKNWDIQVIPNGVDPARFGYKRKRDAAFRRSLGLDSAALVVLSVNRNFQDSQKGHGMVEEALCSASLPGVQVVLAGQNADWAAARLPATLRTVNAGYVSTQEKLAALYEAADIFLFASPAENFPCVILEAMSARCCVVATPTSGVNEQILDGRTGFMAREIEGKALGEVLQGTVARPDEVAAAGVAAREQVEKEFSEQVMVDRHLALYERVVEKARDVRRPH